MIEKTVAFMWGILFKTIVLWITSKLMKFKKQNIFEPFAIAIITFGLSALMGVLFERFFTIQLSLILYFLIGIPILILIDLLLIKNTYRLKWGRTIIMTAIYWGLWITIGSLLLTLILWLFNIIF